MLKIARKWTYFAPILRGSGAALLELRSALKIKELRICGELLASLFNLGVCVISKLNFGGCVMLSDIGYKNKKDFPSSLRRSGV